VSLGVDPIISNLFFTLSLIPHASLPIAPNAPSSAWIFYPFVSVLITFFEETKEDIHITITSLINQTYPKTRYEVLMVVEPNDEATKRYVCDSLTELHRVGIMATVIQSDGKKRLKPHALNIGLRYAKGEVCAFYDASDYIEPDQLHKAIVLMVQERKDAVQAIVLRHGLSFLSRFLLFDTLLWYRKYLPITLRFAKGIPLSGEGLFIRTNALREVGYFPEVLTEDAEMGLLLTEKAKAFALLDSVVIEKAAPFKFQLTVLRKPLVVVGLGCLKAASRAQFSCPGFGPR